ncbi:MAG: DUF2189 domain-containing protein [Rhodocyclales bacterium]|nr:DUF2189 domain-containing protein [Rhodocyclales bacterium]
MTDYAQGPDSAFVLPQIRKVPYDQAVRWLGEGWGDLRRVPAASLAYGVCFALASWLMTWVFSDAYALFAGLLMGFLLLGPALAMGLYDLSRRLGLGEQPRFLDTVTAWRPNLANIGILAAVLGVLFLLWARASMVVFVLFFDTSGLPTFADVLRAVFAFEQPKFAVVYFGVGGLFAALAFVISVIALPMMLDRKVDAVNAALASMTACARNPAAMLVWAACIVSLIVGSFAAGFVGLVVVMPWLGHATWHAYRDLTAKPG